MRQRRLTMSSRIFTVRLYNSVERKNLTDFTALNQVFTSWYYATDFATTQAALAITGIIDDVDPDKKASGLLNDLLTAFSLGFAFIGIPEVEATELAVKTIASIVLTAAQQAPGVIKALWPTGHGTQTRQMESLSDSLGALTTQFQDNINNALQLVQSDIPSFLAFAGRSVFSDHSPPSLPNETYGLEAAFKTYLVSTYSLICQRISTSMKSRMPRLYFKKLLITKSLKNV